MAIIRLKPAREKSLRRLHPWVFAGSIDRVEGPVERGDTVDIVDANRTFFARGFISPDSQIRARVWTFDKDEQIDEHFFLRKIEAATRFRERVVPPDTTACRLVFSESDGLPGLIVDRYGEYLVTQFLTVGVERWRDIIIDHLINLFSPRGIWDRSDTDARLKEGLWSRSENIFGSSPPELLEISQRGVKYLVDIRSGHKTGFYLDQQENREAIARHCVGASVLNCFSYTGGFALAALQAGADRVTNLDSAQRALDIAEQAMTVNGFEPSRAGYICDDAFEMLRTLMREKFQFDVVILDPPKFVDSAQQVKQGSRGYKDINMLAMRLLVPGGRLFTFSCSGSVEQDLFQKIVADAALDVRRTAQFIGFFGQSADHPIRASFPEARYLKGIHCIIQ